MGEQCPVIGEQDGIGVRQDDGAQLLGQGQKAEAAVYYRKAIASNPRLSQAYAGLEFVYPQSLYALSIGVVQVILWAAYLRALKVEETSRIAGQVYVFPVFVFLGEFFLFG